MSTCDQARNLMMKALDGLAGEAERAELDRHVRTCATCRREWSDFRATKDATDQMRDTLAFDHVLDEIQAGLMTRFLRGAATGLIVAGLLVLGVFLVLEVLLADQVPIAVRSGVALLSAGALLFLWEALRWKWRTAPHDPYKDILR